MEHIYNLGEFPVSGYTARKGKDKHMMYVPCELVDQIVVVLQGRQSISRYITIICSL